MKTEDDEFGPIDLTNVEPDKVDLKCKQCQKRNGLIKTQDELIKFYTQIIENSAMFLHVHHWEESIENIEKGRELRFKIEQLKNEIK